MSEAFITIVAGILGIGTMVALMAVVMVSFLEIIGAISNQPK